MRSGKRIFSTSTFETLPEVCGPRVCGPRHAATMDATARGWNTANIASVQTMSCVVAHIRPNGKKTRLPVLEIKPPQVGDGASTAV